MIDSPGDGDATAYDEFSVRQIDHVICHDQASFLQLRIVARTHWISSHLRTANRAGDFTARERPPLAIVATLRRCDARRSRAAFGEGSGEWT